MNHLQPPRHLLGILLGAPYPGAPPGRCWSPGPPRIPAPRARWELVGGANTGPRSGPKRAGHTCLLPNGTQVLLEARDTLLCQVLPPCMSGGLVCPRPVPQFPLIHGAGGGRKAQSPLAH